MDKYSGKRAIGGLCVPKKSSSLVLRDTTEDRDGDAQFCNRIGCSGRLNYSKGTLIGSSKKPKSWRPFYHSSCGKETIGSSSRTCSIATTSKKNCQESHRKLSSKLEAETSESSSAQDEAETQELIASPKSVRRRFQSEVRETETGKVRSTQMVTSTVASTARNQNSFRKKSGLTNQDTLDSSASCSSESSGQGGRMSANASKYGLRNPRNPISDALPPSCLLSESNNSKRRDIVKKRSPGGESSSSAGGKKKTSGQPSENGRISAPANGFSFPDSRRQRNWPPSTESGAASVRTRRSMNGNIRIGQSNQVNRNDLSPNESSAANPQAPQSELFFSSSMNEESFSSRSSSYGHPSSNNVDHMMTITSAELGIARLMNRDGSRRYNMDGIAEVLLALERIEQDEELSYEHLIALETNLFIGGLTFYDQHRDMRLDIDNMSYEELLALEEKMGSVSTALSEDALSKSLRRSIYRPVAMEEATSSSEREDAKCSICQEEYVTGDEVGTIGCEHGYHMGCIKQWLRLKNWCPICKASVAPSETSC